MYQGGVHFTIAEGIRLMSVQRGVDPREFTLMGFGGASGLHAAEVARQLQVERVYIPASAPVLSAYGMLNTDIRYDFSPLLSGKPEPAGPGRTPPHSG